MRHLARRDRRRTRLHEARAADARVRHHARDGAREAADQAAERGHDDRPLGQGRRLTAVRQVPLHGRRHGVHARQGQLRVPRLKQESVEQDLAALPDTVDVHYDPADPQDAYLKKHTPTCARALAHRIGGSASGDRCSRRADSCTRMNDDDLGHLRRCVELAEQALDSRRRAVRLRARGRRRDRAVRGPQPRAERRRHPAPRVRDRALGGAAPDARRARRGDRLHVGRALPDVLGRARLGRARPDRLRRARASSSSAWLSELGVPRRRSRALPITEVVPGAVVDGPGARARRADARAAPPLPRGRVSGRWPSRCS